MPISSRRAAAKAAENDSNPTQNNTESEDNSMAVYDKYGFDGLKDGGTFVLDSTTSTAIKDDPSQIVGKTVALNGNYTVGYGTSGDTILGVVEQVEYENGKSGTMCVSVLWQRTFENISCVGSETAGQPLAVDGSGGVALSGTSSAPVFKNAIALGVNATGKTCTIRVL